MPKGILGGEEAKQAAVFVAAYAGQIGKGPVVDTAERPKPTRLPARPAEPRARHAAVPEGAPAKGCLRTHRSARPTTQISTDI